MPPHPLHYCSPGAWEGVKLLNAAFKSSEAAPLVPLEEWLESVRAIRPTSPFYVAASIFQSGLPKGKPRENGRTRTWLERELAMRAVEYERPEHQERILGRLSEWFEGRVWPAWKSSV